MDKYYYDTYHNNILYPSKSLLLSIKTLLCFIQTNDPEV